MLVLDQGYKPVDRVASFVLARSEKKRQTTFYYLFGKLVAYMPHNRRSLYSWLMVLSYRSGQRLTATQYSPPHLRVVLLSKWELGLVLGHWGIGLKLGQPLLWLKRLQGESGA